MLYRLLIPYSFHKAQGLQRGHRQTPALRCSLTQNEHAQKCLDRTLCLLWWPNPEASSPRPSRKTNDYAPLSCWITFPGQKLLAGHVVLGPWEMALAFKLNSQTEFWSAMGLWDTGGRRLAHGCVEVRRAKVELCGADKPRGGATWYKIMR